MSLDSGQSGEDFQNPSTHDHTVSSPIQPHGHFEKGSKFADAMSRNAYTAALSEYGNRVEPSPDEHELARIPRPSAGQDNGVDSR